MTCDSERPCTRCIKRNIGHLCHDEPREPPSKRSKSDLDQGVPEDSSVKNEYSGLEGMPAAPTLQDTSGNVSLQDTDIALRPPAADVHATSQAHGQSLTGEQTMLGYNDQWPGAQHQFQDMHNFHPSYMFNAPEVTNEYNLLNDFLSTSLLDDSQMYSGEEFQGVYSDPSLINEMAASLGGSNGQLQAGLQPHSGTSSAPTSAAQGAAITRPSSAVPLDKARETYYMTAADPSGTDPPEERMNKLLKAKYDAGMLKPFNYVKGYARLMQYMEQHMQAASRQKILRQLDKFRPKFRERMQSLNDIELVLVEMWFERSLMEYDRVFASMAIPACCWRRTGEIFRGNKEMAELINVPIESMRDVSKIPHVTFNWLTWTTGQTRHPRDHCGRPIS